MPPAEPAELVELAFDRHAGGVAGTLLGALVIAARHRGVHLSAAQLVRDHLLQPNDISPERLTRIASASGLRAVLTSVPASRLTRLGQALPVIVVLRNGAAMVLLRTETDAQGVRLVLQDPNAGPNALLVIGMARLAEGWSGQIILIKRDYRLRDEARPFGLGTLVGLLLRDGRITRSIAFAAFLTSLLAIAPIMFWRLLIDQVLYYQNTNTLLVLVLAMAVLIAFETAFGHIRRYLTLHITKRIDTFISIEIFDKLLNLPIDFFERTPTGEITRDIGEVWKIRRFLTGQLFGTLLDGMIIVLILPILFVFSATLTAVVLGFAAMICIWLLVMMPFVRRKAGAVFRAEGAKSSFLVESLYGIRTIKSLAVEARRRHEWDVHVARTADLRFDEGRTANLIQTVVLPLERLMTSGVFALAVYLAVTTQDQVYVGALVAFMMLTMRLAAPLSQLATLMPDYDEARFAVKVIAKMINHPPEEGRSGNAVRTPIVGRIDFSEVTFRYPGATSPALDSISFTIPEGSVFGIMGRSGSGKTTVTRLLQMLHNEYAGLIKIDGTDLRAFDLDRLRSSLGVVLQENFLFRGTIRETIAQARPDATMEDVIRAARLAGAEEFIERMPHGYETWLQEGSSNLSGGQRQRLAIARALITDPRILILDEATSALDADSEAIVNANLMSIARNRTLLIISHRLSSLITADAILVLERGRVYDIGRHAELLERCDIYSALWRQQHRHLTLDYDRVITNA